MDVSSYHIKKYWGPIIVLILFPILLYASFSILPTHDDWAGTTKPDFSPFFIKEHFFFYGYHWRPFDTWIGYIVGQNPQLLYPMFNHICVIIGHVICSLLIFKLTYILGFNRTACNIATLFFFITPASMATVLAVDSQNQTYALVWGIVAFICYIKLKKGKYLIWPILIIIATLTKENGLMWALISPILAYGFNFINQKTLKRDLLVGIGIILIYVLAIWLFPKDIIIHPEYVPDNYKVVKNLVKFFFTTFITVDYIYLLHQPHRNLLLAGISFILALPFLYIVFIKQWRLYKEKQMICIIICLFIAVGPHLLTVFSMMHTYAGLGLLAIIVAHNIDPYDNNVKLQKIPFIFFLIGAMMINVHLWHESVKSGLIGKKMAQEAVKKTGFPAKNVYVIIIEDNYPKLSSFCVIPNEAFGWGWASRYETNYLWPECIQDTTIERSSEALSKAKKIAIKKLQENIYDCIWVVDYQEIDVIKK